MNERHKIIVIDDEPDTVTFLTALLEDNGYAVIAAGDGNEGLDKTRRERPDLILLDITMPEKSGVKYYRELRGDPEVGSTPVVMVTGISGDFERFISTRSQVPPPEGYIGKPVDQEQLLATIARLLADAN